MNSSAQAWSYLRLPDWLMSAMIWKTVSVWLTDNPPPVCLFDQFPSVCLFQFDKKEAHQSIPHFRFSNTLHLSSQGIPGDHCPPGLKGHCASGSDTNVRAAGGGGQPCLWWSQGCSIGCDFCLTDSKHPANNGTIRTKPITGNPPHADKAGFRKSYCEKPSTKAVLPKESYRNPNRNPNRNLNRTRA